MIEAAIRYLGEECDHGTSEDATGVGLIGWNMPNGMRSIVTLHVVSSIDGFIAKKDNNISWMDSPSDSYEKGVTDGGGEVLESIDCYVLGSRTYEHALELGWPYGDTPTVVVTNRELQSTRGSVEFYSGDLKKLVVEKLAPRYRNIWVVGGAVVCQGFLSLGLVDEIRLMIAPALLGDGLRLFENSGSEQGWRLRGVAGYKNGYVGLWYERRTTNS